MNRFQRLSTYRMSAITLLIVLTGCSATDRSASTETGHASVVPTMSSSAKAAEALDPDADRILKLASDTLSKANRFAFKAEIWSDEVVDESHKISTTKTMDVQVRRSDGLHVEVRSPKRSRGFFYDGKTLTLLDRAKNLYGVVNAPDSIEKMLDAANDQYGITIPLDDLIVADPYRSATPAIRASAYLGKATILGVPCHHVAFSTPAVDWQLWVEDGAASTPRKIVITYKNEATSPQYTAIFSDWDLAAEIPDTAFSFSPPEGSAKIDILPAKREAE